MDAFNSQEVLGGSRWARAAFIVLKGLVEQQERNGVITRDEINAIPPSGAQSIPGRAKRRRSSVDQKLEA